MSDTGRGLLLACVLIAATLAAPAHQRVTALPGVDISASNASHFAGYLRVQADVNTTTDTFYYFVEHADPAAPLLVWMNGGPGASSLMGFFTELGPLLLNSRSFPEHSAGGGWQPLSNPYAWSTEANLLVWEQPAGVGFSRCIGSTPCPIWNDTSSAAANLQVLRAFYKAFPEHSQRDLVIAGESYAGVYVPLLAKQVHEHNAREEEKEGAAATTVPLRGIMVGNGCVGYGVQGGCGLDSLDLLVTVLEQGAPGVNRGVLAAARAACKGELDTGKSPQQLSAACRPAVDSVLEEIAVYNQYSWGSPCGPDGTGNWGDGTGFSCGASEGLQRYLSSAATQRALHVIGAGSDTPLPSCRPIPDSLYGGHT